MAYYGLDADIQANPDKNILKYIPGETKLTAQDVFMGGQGTGVTDDMIGQATRVQGRTTEGTRKALEHYESDLASQIKAVIAQNDAPRADAYRGRPGMARLLMEQDQAKAAVSNNLANKTYVENLRQAALDNEWRQKTFDYNASQDAKNFDYGVSQDTIANDYRNAALAASSAKASSGGSSGGSSSSKKGAEGGKYSDSATVSMKNKMDSALASGATVDELLGELGEFEEDGSAYLSNYDVDYLKSYLETKRPTVTEQQSTPSSFLSFLQKWR